MSTVERALEKLRQARAQEREQTPIARVADAAEVLTDVPGASGPVSGRLLPGGRNAPAIQAPGKCIEFDLQALHVAGLLSPSNRALAEQYRAIKQPLLRHARKDADLGNLIMVASALAGEGKTFTCVNLSLSLATEKDWEALLVDVDCRNPQLSRLLGVEGEPGLMELLRDPSLDPASLIMSTSIDGLSMLPVGTPDQHASEMLASSRMTDVCRQLSVQYPRRITLFDSSPLLLTTESSILGTQVGQVVLVVRANRTPQSAVLEAAQKLDPEKAIGVVLNRATVIRGGGEYGSYGSYAYTAESADAAQG